MKKKVYSLIGVMIILIIGALLTLSIFRKKGDDLQKEDEVINVVTSFYPVYIIGANLAHGVDGLQVSSLTSFNTGCPHDYQLTTNNMKLLSNADIFVMNGGGMESFLEDIIENFPQLYIIDSSTGIDMLDSKGHKGHQNTHIWLDPSRYINQISNVQDGIIDYIKENNLNDYMETDMGIIDNNGDNYIDKVAEINEQFDELAKSVQRESKAVVFHDAFEYLAHKVGIQVVHSIEIEGHEALSASEIADVITLINDQGVPYLFTELQFGNSIIDPIEEETDAKIYIIDSAVTGDGSTGSYIEAMERNLSTLEDALN